MSRIHDLIPLGLQRGVRRGHDHFTNVHMSRLFWLEQEVVTNHSLLDTPLGQIQYCIVCTGQIPIVGFYGGVLANRFVQVKQH